MIRLTSLAAAAALFAMPALAQDFTAVQTIEKMVVTQTDAGDSDVEFVVADRVLPGDNLYYELSYKNDTPENADNVNLVMIVPPEVVYRENSATIADATTRVDFSADGGATFFPRGELVVTQNGAQRPAISEEITHIRWSFGAPVASGAEGSVGFNAVVR